MNQHIDYTGNTGEEKITSLTAFHIQMDPALGLK